MAFLCEKHKGNYGIVVGRSYGRCEVCKEESLCYDVMRTTRPPDKKVIKKVKK